MENIVDLSYAFSQCSDNTSQSLLSNILKMSLPPNIFQIISPSFPPQPRGELESTSSSPWQQQCGEPCPRSGLKRCQLWYYEILWNIMKLTESCVLILVFENVDYYINDVDNNDIIIIKWYRPRQYWRWSTLFCRPALHLALSRIRVTPACPYLTKEIKIIPTILISVNRNPI